MFVLSLERQENNNNKYTKMRIEKRLVYLNTTIASLTIFEKSGDLSIKEISKEVLSRGFYTVSFYNDYGSHIQVELKKRITRIFLPNFKKRSFVYKFFVNKKEKFKKYYQDSAPPEFKKLT